MNLGNNRHSPFPPLPLIFKGIIGTDPKLIALIENAFAGIAGFGADVFSIGIITPVVVVVCKRNLRTYNTNEYLPSFC